MSLASMETCFKDMDSSALNVKIKLVEVTLFTLSSTDNYKVFALGTTDCEKKNIITEELKDNESKSEGNECIKQKKSKA